MNTCCSKEETIGIIGLGYVGLPLACLFATKYEVRGFDLDGRRVDEINRRHDATREVPEEELDGALSSRLVCTTELEALRDCTFYIVAVPTPVDSRHNPDLSYLESASRAVGSVLKPGDMVVFESTVYPGTTEEFCIPVIEQVSGLSCDRDFQAGYSPERVNPGDREHTVRNICKIVSGSSEEAAERVDRVYSSVLTGGTYLASSIKVAEAAKIIENTQRDVNIAFINEVVKVFNALHIDTDRVLEAASTKWNFLPFRPGLVGGHCISVDPYYLIRKAELHGLRPRLMTEARSINETMGYYLADSVVAAINKRGMTVNDAKILMLGFAFKEDCPDIRNTKVHDTLASLQRYASCVVVYDPVVDIGTVRREYGDVPVTGDFDTVAARGPFDVVVRCVNHACFAGLDLGKVTAPGYVECAIINPELCGDE